ncbi:sigma-70 family RNA polymerase sigma factor [Reichenbachiella sp. MALMAid0571]|uniref:RNA polymerase sigma factor n=1 Tax=Reichenbachiella sp. MALMAid0571 TaxID=3143939 RepID=UPI0032DEDE42
MSNSFDHITDIKLWRQFKKGNKDAYRILFDKYSPILYHYGLSYVGNEELIEDCIHELFLNIWESKKSLADVESVKYYLIVSFRRTISKQQTLIKKRTEMNDSYFKYATDQEDNSIQEFIINEQTKTHNSHILTEAISNLPEKQRRAVTLRFFENKKYEEIMLIMSISYQSARKFVYLGIKKLRENLKSQSYNK